MTEIAAGFATAKGEMFSRVRAWLLRCCDIRHHRAARRLRVRENLPLGDKRQLLLVEAAGKQFLIGAAGNFLTTLADLGPAEKSEQGSMT